MPFKAVVIYDGGFKTAFATMNQTIEGFYQASRRLRQNQPK